MWATRGAGIVNAVLDLLFIFGLDLGLDRAAIASVIARFTLFGMAMGYAVRRYDAFAWPRVEMLKRDLSGTLGLVIPAVLTDVATPIGAPIVVREKLCPISRPVR